VPAARRIVRRLVAITTVRALAAIVDIVVAVAGRVADIVRLAVIAGGAIVGSARITEATVVGHAIAVAAIGGFATVGVAAIAAAAKITAAQVRTELSAGEATV
jgi:hypothetical protein